MQKFSIWDDLIPYATPLFTMRIIDAGGENELPRTRRDFNSSEISGLPFGWNIPNSILKEELIKKIYTLSNVQLCFGVNSTKIVTRTSEAKVWLSNGESIKAKLALDRDAALSGISIHSIHTDNGVFFIKTSYGTSCRQRTNYHI